MQLDRTLLKDWVKDTPGAYLLGPGARSVLTGSALPDYWSVITLEPAPPFRNFETIQEEGKVYYLALKLLTWIEPVDQYLRECLLGKDAIALHLKSGAVLFAEEYWRDPHHEIRTRATKPHAKPPTTQAT